MAIYNPKSLKAEEFISDEEILETIRYAEENKHNAELIDRILEKARPVKNGNGVTSRISVAPRGFGASRLRHSRKGGGNV